MKKKRRTKHVRQRAYQRYDIKITEEELRQLISQIQSNRSEPIMKYSNTYTLHLCSLLDRKLPVVYDKSRQMIVTVLPENARELAEY